MHLQIQKNKLLFVLEGPLNVVEIQGCRGPLFTLTVLLNERAENSILKIAGARTWLWSVYFPHVMAEQQSDLQLGWLLSRVRLSVTPWTAALQASLSITNPRSLLRLAQTQSRVSDAIQPSHALSSPPPAFSLSQHQGLFQRVSSLHQMAKVL